MLLLKSLFLTKNYIRLIECKIVINKPLMYCNSVVFLKRSVKMTIKIGLWLSDKSETTETTADCWYIQFNMAARPRKGKEKIKMIYTEWIHLDRGQMRSFMIVLRSPPFKSWCGGRILFIDRFQNWREWRRRFWNRTTSENKFK